MQPEESVPSRPVTEQDVRRIAGRPPVTGAWREGDPVAYRRFLDVGPLPLEWGDRLPQVRVAFETWGALDSDRTNAILVEHAFTGDAHVAGETAPGQPTSGWWEGMVGPGRALDTDHWFVVCSNILGGCQGTTGPSSLAPDGSEWGSRFPQITIRDQVAAQARLADHLGIRRWAAVVGGSMGGMQALEWGVMYPERVARLAVMASAAALSADQIASALVQEQAITGDPAFRDGDYFDELTGPHRGLALARRIALLTYRGAAEFDSRFGRSAQSEVTPLGGGGRFAVESYLDFHGNTFTRRFDADSYLVLLHAMNSHDVGRERGGITKALSRLVMPTLVVGVDTDRLFPLIQQEEIAALAPGALGHEVQVISAPYGHDSFLIEKDDVARGLRRLLSV